MKNSYLAGLFDGEGCITVNHLKYKHKSQFVLHIQVTNAYLPLLSTLKHLFGGQVVDYTKNRSCIYTWICRANKALVFLGRVYPHSIVKAKQIELGIFFQKNIRKISKLQKQRIRRKLQELKRVRYNFGTP